MMELCLQDEYSRKIPACILRLGEIKQAARVEGMMTDQTHNRQALHTAGQVATSGVDNADDENARTRDYGPIRVMI